MFGGVETMDLGAGLFTRCSCARRVAGISFEPLSATVKFKEPTTNLETSLNLNKDGEQGPS